MKKLFICLAVAVLCCTSLSAAGKKLKVDSLKSFKVTSQNLKGGYWETKCGYTKENISPELSWKSVDGATQYAVFMIDGGWCHMDVFTDVTNLEEGILKDKPRGFQYVGPYPPDNTHKYVVYVFALKKEPGKVKFLFNSGGNAIDLIYGDLDKDADGNAGNVIACGQLKGGYKTK